MRGNFIAILQFRLNRLGEGLSELFLVRHIQRDDETNLNTPLIERVDVPDDSLDEDFMLIHGNQTPKSTRVQGLIEDRISGMVSEEDLIPNETLKKKMRTDFMG